jgi:hypothetical protein
MMNGSKIGKVAGGDHKLIANEIRRVTRAIGGGCGQFKSGVGAVANQGGRSAAAEPRIPASGILLT